MSIDQQQQIEQEDPRLSAGSARLVVGHEG